jgi:LppP/LprE lipoprotein
VKLAEITIRAKGYKAVPSSIAKTPGGVGKTLYAVLGICEGSADGHCQKVFFFLDDRYLGTDTKSPSNEIKSEVAVGTGSIDVTYANYKTDDPLCCPSGQPVTIRYKWNGTRLSASGIPPGH